METDKKYFAFISYKREDEEWAIWLQHELEYYHLPASLNGRDDLPTEFRPVFRDIDELKAGNLPAQIYEALVSSSNLIVICSPHSANSKWVNKEIADFIEIGKKKGVNNLEKIFPFIVEGLPHSIDESQECFPQILRNLPDNKERIGGNVNESGRDKAFIKTMAGMLANVSMDMLWNRYERDKAEEERRKREERDKLYRAQSRFVAEKASRLIEDGDTFMAQRLLLDVLPKSLTDPDKPCTFEAEMSFREAFFTHTAIIGHGHFDSVVFGTDWKLIMTGSETVSVLDAKSGVEIHHKLGHHSNFINVNCISPDGKQIALGDEKLVRVMDVKSGVELQSFEGHLYKICSMAFSHDGKLVVSASVDDTARIWNVETGKEMLVFKGHNGTIKSAVFNPDDKLIVSASHDKTVKIWDAKDGKEYLSLAMQKRVMYATFSPDGKRIVSGSDDNVVKIWDVESGKEIVTLVGQVENIKHSNFSPDGKFFVYVSNDNVVRVLDSKNGFEIQSYKGHTGDVIFAVFSPDGKLVASASSDKTIKIWETDSGKEVQTCVGHLGRVKYATFSPDGKSLVSLSHDCTMRIWTVESKAEIKMLKGHSGWVVSTAFSPDGKLIVSASFDRTIRIWDIVTGAEIRTLEGHTDEVLCVAFSPDGKRIVSASKDKTIKIWSLESGREDRTLIGHIASVISVSYSSDGKRIVSASSDETVKIWDSETGQEIQTIIDRTECERLAFYAENQMELYMDATFSPTGECIAWRSPDFHGFQRIWNINSDERIEILTDGNNLDPLRWPASQAFSFDGNRIVYSFGNKTLKIYKSISGEEIKSIEILKLTEGIVFASLSPDGTYIVSALKDNSVRVFDADTGAEIQIFKGHTSYVNMAAFSPDGKHIVSASKDGTIIIWPFPPLQDLIDQTRERFKDRPLTPEERHQYYLE